MFVTLPRKCNHNCHFCLIMVRIRGNCSFIFILCLINSTALEPSWIAWSRSLPGRLGSAHWLYQFTAASPILLLSFTLIMRKTCSAHTAQFSKHLPADQGQSPCAEWKAGVLGVAGSSPGHQPACEDQFRVCSCFESHGYWPSQLGSDVGKQRMDPRGC